MVFAAAFVCVAPPGRSAEKIDLKRITPVPADQIIPIQDFFRPSLLMAPKLNDAGTHLAALVTTGRDKTALVIHDLAKPASEALICSGPGDRDIYSFYWLNDERVLFSVSEDKRFGVGAYVADVSGSRLNAYPVLERAIAPVVGVPEARRTFPLMWIRGDYAPSGDGRKGRVVEINTNLDLRHTTDPALLPGPEDSPVARFNRNERHIARTYPELDAGFTTGYLVDKHGELAFGFATRDGRTRLFQLAAGAWQECPVDPNVIDVISYGDNPGELIVLEAKSGTGPRGLYFMDAATGRIGDPVLKDAGYDIHGSIIRDPGSRQILGVSFERHIPTIVWFIEDYRIVQKYLDAQFKGQVVRLWPADRTGKNFFLSVSSDRQPLIYYRVNFETRQLTEIEKTAPWIDPARMRPMSTFKFKTREGRQLDAYITLPAGASKENPAPLVVLSHGGPFVRDTWGYDAQVQFLASRGYAVLQPNYRGSTGTTWMFTDEELWDFRAMHDDVTAATQALLKTGLIDRDRVAIMGGSFGGYLAISGVVNEPALYRCAITVAGVFDWGEVVRDARSEQFDNAEFGTLRRWLGDPAQHPEKYDAISPGRFVERIQVPVLVMHDRDDFVVAADESKRLIASLKKLNKPHEVFFSRGEGHGPKHVKDAIEYYSRVEDFLARNLAARPAASPSDAP